MNDQPIDNEELQRIRDLANDDIAFAGDTRLLLTELDRLHTWNGLMDLLNEHWPEGIIPTLLDDNQRDLGPRVVSLLHWVRELQDWKNNATNLINSIEATTLREAVNWIGIQEYNGGVTVEEITEHLLDRVSAAARPIEDRPNGRPIEHDTSTTQ